MRLRVSGAAPLRVIVLALLLLLCGVNVITAQSASEADRGMTPDDVVRAVFSALSAKRWPEMAALVHPIALTEFHREQLAQAIEWHDLPTRNPVRDSSVPPAVAEYLDKQWKEMMARQRNPALAGFARVKSLDDLKALSAPEFFARWLEGHDPQPQNYAGGEVPRWTRTVVGTVTETESLAHVVYRVVVLIGARPSPPDIKVVTVRRIADGWRILLNDDLSAGVDGTLAIGEPE